MDSSLINRWNYNVKSGDTVYHLGDFSFHPELYREKLNGNIILIKGNHDRTKNAHLFDEFHHRLAVDLGVHGDIKCVLSHKPIKTKQDKYDFVICGHIHEKWLLNKRNVNVGVDQWGFRPIHIDELTKFMRWVQRERKSFLKKND